MILIKHLIILMILASTLVTRILIAIRTRTMSIIGFLIIS
jgi:hypothetical protein